MIREIVCGLSHMYGVTRILGIEVSSYSFLYSPEQHKLLSFFIYCGESKPIDYVSSLLPLMLPFLQPYSVIMHPEHLTEKLSLNFIR